jgi:hypothetical protein
MNKVPIINILTNKYKAIRMIIKDKVWILKHNWTPKIKIVSTITYLSAKYKILHRWAINKPSTINNNDDFIHVLNFKI